MKDIDKSSPNYLNDLEEKIVELSLKLKSKENELESFQKEELPLFKNFIHNLKNPLGVINSFSNMVLEGGENIFSENQYKYLNIIQNSSSFSLNFLNDFADYYLLKNSNKIFEKSTINLFQTILKEVEALKSLASERNILVEIRKSNDDVYLNSNEKKLGNIINAIIHNAIRFSENNAKVLVELTNSASKIEIRVIDQGIGIAENNLSKIYNEFFVCNTYAVDKKKCIGLGLSCSKILVERLNGTLQIKSELNKGTTALLSFEKK